MSFNYTHPDCGGSRGANPAMAPPIEIGNGVWPPFRDRKSNGSIVILLKSKEFGVPHPPVLMSAADLAPYGKIPYIKHEKGR